ncbi:MAG: cupin domain-containing protein [Chloroflexi bacterium]|nr:cupin domain-containing protein [Chloroflexota bacterium]
MKLIRVSELTKQDMKGNPLFTGMVTMQAIIDESIDQSLRISQVNFSKGARNKMHTHSVPQVLIVTAGKGLVASDKVQVTVGIGDIIYIPAGERHWHGATPDSEFSHIYVLPGGYQTTQVEQ